MQSGLIFDLDGTLIDSVYHHVIAWHDTLTEAGVAIDLWRCQERIGMSGDLFVRAILREIDVQLDDEKIEQMTAGHDEHYAKRAESVRPLRGSKELLAALVEAKVPFAIGTAGKKEATMRALEPFGLPDSVPVVTSEDVEFSKPNGDSFLVAAERLSMAPRDCFAVGDSIWDLLAAKRAGMNGIGLLSGGNARSALEATGAYRVYDDALDLLRHLDELGIRALSPDALRSAR